VSTSWKAKSAASPSTVSGLPPIPSSGTHESAVGENNKKARKESVKRKIWPVRRRIYAL